MKMFNLHIVVASIENEGVLFDTFYLNLSKQLTQNNDTKLLVTLLYIKSNEQLIILIRITN